VALVGYGYGADLARRSADAVAAVAGVRPTVVNARFAKPLDTRVLRQIAARHELVVTIEDHAALGGFGSAVAEAVEDIPCRLLRVGLPDRFVDHGKRDILLAEVGLTPEGVTERVRAALRRPAGRVAAV
jgi:1-deoxy-D-xylulose-5-phosphate synthase